LESGTEDPLFDIDFVDELNGFICGFNGIILHTSNGGQDWTKMVSPLGTEHLYSIDMLSKNTGYICTHTGHILKMDLSSASNNIGFSKLNVQIYPNPIRNNAILNLDVANLVQLKKIELCNAAGQCKMMYPSYLNSKQLELDFTFEKSGYYYLTIQTNSNRENIPIYIENTSN